MSLQDLHDRKTLLSGVLADLLPLAIAEREASVWGGPTPLDHATAQEWRVRHLEDPDFVMPVMGMSREPGWLNRLIRVLIVLSFEPGGIRIFGSHFVGGEANRQRTAEVYGKAL